MRTQFTLLLTTLHLLCVYVAAQVQVHSLPEKDGPERGIKNLRFDRIQLGDRSFDAQRDTEN